MPVQGDELARLQVGLRTIPRLVEQAKGTLTEVAADFADFAIFNLTSADGVGSGHPYRAIPPAGIIGWFEDLQGRAGQQPELRADIMAALAAIRDFHDWLVSNRERMTAKAAVGEAAYDWFLKHAMLLPYTSDEVVAISQRELDRTWAFYALERHRNRHLPEIEIAASEEEYLRRVAETDAFIRQWLRDEEIIAVPEFIPADWRAIGFGVPVDRPARRPQFLGAGTVS